MIFSRSCAFALLLVSCVTGLAATARKTAARADAYKGAIVIDAANGNVLFEDRADVISPPASMTKLMTFAVLHDQLASRTITLEQPVNIADEDARMGGTQVFLDPRETFSVEELIYAMMIQSANDASHALARTAAGSVEAFVELMNAKAQALGMTNTTFRTPHGLPPASRKIAQGDLTTPRDFAVLSRHLVLKTDVLKYASVVSRPFGTGVRAQPMVMKNHNKLIGKVAGVDGLKTGFTDAAGYCLSATAQRNGRRVIMVIMGSLGPNGQRDLGRARDIKAIELIDRGFAALPALPAPPQIVSDSPLQPAPAPSRTAPTRPAKPVSLPSTSTAPAAPREAESSATVKFVLPKK